MRPPVKTPGTFIAAVLNGAEFENHGTTSARIRDLTARAKALIAEVEAAAP